MQPVEWETDTGLFVISTDVSIPKQERDRDKHLPRLQIEGRGMTARSGYRISLDGQELRGLRSLTLSMDKDDVNTVVLEMCVRDVAVDAQALVDLVAKADEEGAEGG